MTTTTENKLSLSGLTLAPSQVWGGIRLVPVLRTECPGDLRIMKRVYSEDTMAVSVDHGHYYSYVPHGFVLSWNDKAGPAAAFGANMATNDGKRFGDSLRLSHRMVKRGQGKTARILPLHLAMEGFLALHFGGPEIAWNDLSRTLLTRGLSPRFESSVGGRWIAGLDEALRIFEVHENQVGVLCFVADSLASAFVLSHPEDYRALHHSLLDDFFGDLLYQYGLLYPSSAELLPTLSGETCGDIPSLRAGLKSMQREWSEFGHSLAASLFERPLQLEKVYRMGPFQLQRFVTDLDCSQENHIGETIVNADGGIEYLKTYRLSAAQTRRAYLLSCLAKHDWNLSETASFFGQSKGELARRLDKAGFGYFLKAGASAG